MNQWQWWNVWHRLRYRLTPVITSFVHSKIWNHFIIQQYSNSPPPFFLVRYIFIQVWFTCPPRIPRNIVVHSYKKTLFYLIGYAKLEIYEVQFEKTSPKCDHCRACVARNQRPGWELKWWLTDVRQQFQWFRRCTVDSQHNLLLVSKFCVKLALDKVKARHPWSASYVTVFC